VAEAAQKNSKIVQVALSEKPMIHRKLFRFPDIGIPFLKTLFCVHIKNNLTTTILCLT